ncbi:MAG TPA: hypothetical protein VJP07_00560 [Dehalococcoidia bacterium]|nr:hypothetical protein [Dehalococcoidia bacterium]
MGRSSWRKQRVVAARLAWPDARIPHEIAAYKAELHRACVPVDHD